MSFSRTAEDLSFFKFFYVGRICRIREKFITLQSRVNKDYKPSKQKKLWQSTFVKYAVGNTTLKLEYPKRASLLAHLGKKFLKISNAQFVA